ncbi:MAG: GntR family transcriptional regulator [Candidatus Baltobacteraceae bacterium]
MPAVLTVDTRSGVPIYLQIIEQVKRSVALGVLAPGEQLPTVKQLALDLTVNPNTVARAYRDLERDEVIETSPGRGSFIRGNGTADAARSAASDITALTLDRAVRDAKSIGQAPAQVRAHFDAAIKRWFPEEV